MDKIAVIGLGYVGLPLAVAASNAGFQVSGIDIDATKIKMMHAGHSPIEDISDKALQVALKQTNYSVSTDFSTISNANIIVICVPTPLNAQREPELKFIKQATEQICKYLKKKSLVILESTVAPGTTQHFLAPLIQQTMNFSSEDFDLAYSSERVDPLNKNWNLKNTPKIVAGLNIVSSNRAVNFYKKFVDEVVVVDSLEIAECAKLLENSFRFINISFVNEFSIFCQKSGIDAAEVIRAAATKPYGFMPFYPSIGVGGHCIPVDPLYLSNKAKEIGATTRFIDLADQINQEMPRYFVGRAEEKLGGLKNKKVLVVGVSYKLNVADVRETPVSALINGLKEKGAQVSWHDDLVKEWNDEKSVDLKPGFDLAIIATSHAYIDFTKLGDTPILDTRGSI